MVGHAPAVCAGRVKNLCYKLTLGAAPSSDPIILQWLWCWLCAHTWKERGWNATTVLAPTTGLSHKTKPFGRMKHVGRRSLVEVKLKRLLRFSTPGCSFVVECISSHPQGLDIKLSPLVGRNTLGGVVWRKSGWRCFYASLHLGCTFVLECISKHPHGLVIRLSPLGGMKLIGRRSLGEIGLKPLLRFSTSGLFLWSTTYFTPSTGGGARWEV